MLAANIPLLLPITCCKPLPPQNDKSPGLGSAGISKPCTQVATVGIANLLQFFSDTEKRSFQDEQIVFSSGLTQKIANKIYICFGK